MDLKRMILGGVLSAATLAFIFTALVALGSLVSFGGTLTSNVVGTTTVLKVCYISLSNTAVLFGGGSGMAPGSAIPTQNVITDSDPGGNAQATVLIAAGTGNALGYYSNAIWLGTSSANQIGISNTVYSASLNTAWNSATALSTTLSSTGITITAPSIGTPTTSASVFLGMNVPSGTPADTYTTNIVIENSC